MKKYVLFLFVLVMTALLCMSFAYADVVLPDKVNVGIKYGSSAVAKAELSASGMQITDVYGAPLYDGSHLSSVTVEYSDGVIKLTSNGAVVFSYGGDIMVTPNSGLIKLDGKSYRGSFKFVIKNSALMVINYVGLEDYICGVVPQEIGGSSPAESLKAQAVCSRSYTARFIGRHSSDGFDICSGTHCHVYGGTSRETEASNKAVYDTAGVIAMYGDKIAELYYFASDGGATEDVKNVWGSTVHPYLAAVDDPYETDEASYHKWSVTFTPDDLKTIFAPYNLGDITDISVIETTEKGAVLKLQVTGTNGSRVFEKEKSRTVFGGKIYSQAYSITKNYEGGGTSPSASGASQTVTLPSIVYVMGKDGVVEKRVEEITVMSSTGTSRLQTGGKVVSYTLNGRGWGHLIGMSQWGAIAMGKQGFTYEQILNYYYQGITLVQK